MKRTLTGAAAVIGLTATGVLAQEQNSAARMEMHNNSARSAMSTEDLATAEGNLIRARDITGGQIYTTNEANDEGWNVEVTYDAIGADWNQIGEIEDLVLNSNGQITGIVAEVGGFLDLGDKHVVISVQDLNLVAVNDQTYAYVTKFNEEDLESMQDVDEGFWN